MFIRPTTYIFVLCSFSYGLGLTLIKSQNNSASPTPVVMWHGMGDCCCNPLSLGYLKKVIEEQIPGVYVLSLMIGKNVFEDTENGYFMNVNKQVEMVCEMVAADPKLAQGYNAIGISQGAQFLRAVAQRCPTPRIHKLISIGGQHQGVYGLPHCFYPPHTACDYIRKLLNIGAYWSWVQNEIVQAEYWHDPLDEERYKDKSVFIAEINNERYQNDTYKQNLLKLDKFVMVKFEQDSFVEPHETSWFGFFKEGQADVVLPMNQTKLYTEDRLGLRELDQSGRIDLISLPGDHVQFTIAWFNETIIDKYLR